MTAQYAKLRCMLGVSMNEWCATLSCGQDRCAIQPLIFPKREQWFGDQTTCSHCDLDHWPLDLECLVHGVSRDQRLYQIRAKLDYLLQSYWWFSKFSSSLRHVVTLTLTRWFWTGDANAFCVYFEPSKRVWWQQLLLFCASPSAPNNPHCSSTLRFFKICHPSIICHYRHRRSLAAAKTQPQSVRLGPHTSIPFLSFFPFTIPNWEMASCLLTQGFGSFPQYKFSNRNSTSLRGLSHLITVVIVSQLLSFITP